MTSNPSPPSLRPKPLDALVAAAVVALAMATALLFYGPRTGAGQLTAVITQHGQTVRTVALTGLDKELVIPLDDGTYHLTVRISGDAAYIAESDCPGQDCVHTGAITRAGQSIVCLPAQVVISLVSTSSDVDAVLG